MNKRGGRVKPPSKLFQGDEILEIKTMRAPSNRRANQNHESAFSHTDACFVYSSPSSVARRGSRCASGSTPLGDKIRQTLAVLAGAATRKPS